MFNPLKVSFGRAPARPGRPSARATRAATPRKPSWLRGLLSGELRLRRRGLAFSLVEVPPVEDAEPLKPVLAVRAVAGVDAAALDQMRLALQQLLGRHPQARAIVRHLAFFDRSFRRDGLLAFDTVPLDVLRTALEQFEMLVTNWADRGLAELRSRMALAVADRDRLELGPGGVPVLSVFVGDNRVMVEDASESMFMAAQNQWDPRALDLTAPPAMPDRPNA